MSSREPDSRFEKWAFAIGIVLLYLSTLAVLWLGPAR